MMKLPQERQDAIWEAIATGEMYADIAKRFGVSTTAINKFATSRGHFRNQRAMTCSMEMVANLVAEDPDLLKDRKRLREKVSEITGRQVDRLQVNNIVSRLGLTRPRFKADTIKQAMQSGLRIDAFGLPSYGDEADRAMLELIETDDPPQWLIEAYEPWLEGRKNGVRQLGLGAGEASGDQQQDGRDDL